MSRNTVIALLSVIAFLAVIIAVGAWYLYHDIAPDGDGPAIVAVDEEDPEEDIEVPVTDTPSAPSAPSSSEASAVPAAAPVKDVPVGQAVQKTVREIPEGPFKVRNCATGKYNSIRQNRDNSLELVDEKGKVLWKVPLRGKLCGMVGEVDFYRNGKIQYLLVCEDEVHLIDRLGREVAGFPRTLPAKAILGPEKVSVRGTNFWRVDTEGGIFYLNLKKNQILTQLPE